MQALRMDASSKIPVSCSRFCFKPSSSGAPVTNVRGWFHSRLFALNGWNVMVIAS